ncbi:MAG: hypothetical protein IKR05_07815 [Prevotella sp.]|jgi:hypothetical protein|nr:hypothetical protein [Prevotella sp.]
MKTEDKGFEEWWSVNKQRLLNENKEYRDAVSTYTMSSGADWLLFGIPVATGIICIQSIPISNELLRWLVCLIITVAVFAICVYVKSLSNPHRSISEIEEDVKRQSYEDYLTGKRE